MHQLKPISRDGVTAALHKAERYRLINDPSSAESICLDILAVEPAHQQALVVLLLALTDQFTDEVGERARQARDLLPGLQDEYKRTYYAGIIAERRAQALLRRGAPGSSEMAYDAFHEAMQAFERAESLRPPGNDEAILRWNTCARLLDRHAHLKPSAAEDYEPSLE